MGNMGNENRASSRTVCFYQPQARYAQDEEEGGCTGLDW